jgi:hypothetical protein
MIMLSQNGALTLNILDDRTAGQSKATIDLPADLAAQPNDLFDRVFAFAFDVLGLQTVELRVRTIDAPMRLSGPAYMYRERSA